MASLTSDPNGHRRIQFTDPHGKRRTLRLGKTSKKHAEAVRVKVESLLAAQLAGQPNEAETARWLAALGDDLHARLARAGLIATRSAARLGAFIDGYIRRRVDVKPSTRVTYGRARRYLVGYFGESRDLRTITAGDADDWRLHLLGRGLADNTVRKSCSIAKQFAQAAVRKKLIEINPFADLAGSVKANRSRDYFISREEAAAVLDACPDAEWRVMFALARFGGLRTPSETLGLRWSDVEWADESGAGRFRVVSPKTAHHEGKDFRMVPLFPELVPHLREAFERAEDGAEFVVSRYREHTQNLRTRLHRIIRSAGLDPWPKLWQNLRATRETELAEHYPAHVVCAWIGNSVQVAAKHYLQVTDEHFHQAAQNPTQHPSASTRIEPESTDKNR
ncbi:MAG: tyrosine-type recombinase/integrase, partial [Planctomycetota bacterium]